MGCNIFIEQHAILINLPGDGEFEVITGGSVSARSGTAIEATGASAAVTVSGGAVSSAAGTAIRTTGMSSTVTVSDGFVETHSADAAIQAAGNVDIIGGTVCATTGYAIKNINGSGTVTVSGGFVFAEGNDISDVISQAGIPFSNPDSDGIVVAWDTLTGSGTYSEGTATDLRVFPANTATWHNDAGLGGGINYTNGSNSGFFRLNSATVIAYVPVTGITGIPTAATAGTPLSLMGTVTPANATSQTIMEYPERRCHRSNHQRQHPLYHGGGYSDRQGHNHGRQSGRGRLHSGLRYHGECRDCPSYSSECNARRHGCSQERQYRDYIQRGNQNNRHSVAEWWCDHTYRRKLECCQHCLYHTIFRFELQHCLIL